MASTPSPPPIWAPHLALHSILISLHHLTLTRQEWASLTSSPTTPYIPSLGFSRTTGSAIQPTLPLVASLRVPVEGEAWTEFRSSLHASTEAVQGLRSFRTAVEREIEHLERIASGEEQGVCAPCPATTNAPSLCSFWEHVLLVSLTRGPVTEINASLVVPPEGQDPAVMALRRRRKENNARGGGGGGSGRIAKSKLSKGAAKGAVKTTKVDIVGDGGRSWTRLLTIKKNSLLAELRVAESELGEGALDSASDDSEAGGDDLASSGLSSGRAKRLASHKHLFAQLDFATANCSIVRTIEELLACRAAAAPDSGTEGSSDESPISIHLYLTRLTLPPPNDSPLGLSMSYLTSTTEEERFTRRLQIISNLISRLPHVYLCDSEADRLTAPPGKLLPSSLTTLNPSTSTSSSLPARPEDFDTSTRLALPAMPSPAKQMAQLSSLEMTDEVNVDVSALVALVSDITHMELPERGEGKELDLQSLFRMGGLKSVAEQDRADAKAAAAGRAPGDKGQGRDGGDSQGSMLQNRALAAQLGLESTPGCDFLGYLAEAAGVRSSSSSSSSSSSPPSTGGPTPRRRRRQLHLLCTSEARLKFDEIVRLVGGEREQRRARCLFDEAPGSVEAFWEGSRYEHDKEVRGAVRLPVEVVEFDWREVRERVRARAAGMEKEKEQEASNTFSSIMHATLLAGLEDLAAQEEAMAAIPPSSSKSKSKQLRQTPLPKRTTAANPRQTQHTLSSLLMGLDRGLTTLSTNMLSVRWLIREAGRSPLRRRGGKGGDGGGAGGEGEGELDGDGGKALVWVTNPRSLSERMRVDTPAPMERPTSSAYAEKGITATPSAIDDNYRAPVSTSSSSSTALATSTSRLQLDKDDDADLAPYSLDDDDDDNDASGRDVKSTSASSYAPTFSPSIATSPPPPPLPAWTPIAASTLPAMPSFDNSADTSGSASASASGSASGSGSGSGGTTTAVDVPGPAMLAASSRSESKVGGGGKSMLDAGYEEDGRDRIQTMHELEHGTPANEDDSTSNASPTPASTTTPLRHRNSRFIRSLLWISGPRPAEILSIKHYPWWPFAGIEEAWLDVTKRVAWREPPYVELPLDEPHKPQQGRRRGLQRPAWLRRGMSREVYGLEEMGGAQRSEDEPADQHNAAPRQVHPVTRYIAFFQREYRTNALHWLLLILTYIAWLLGFSFLVKSIWSSASIRPAGTPSSANSEPSFYGCTDSYWSQNARCGLDGEDCRPFSQNTSVAFRCPAGCSGTVLGAARAVGTALPNFVPLIVGGGGDDAVEGTGAGFYRGDSWVCPAAVHAGIIDDRTGGCGLLWLGGTYAGFVGEDAHGLKSESFNSTFPVSYFFDRATISSACTDRRRDVYILDALFSSLVGFILQPRPLVWYYTLISMGFWHINYASEPRDYPPTPGGPMGDFLPTLFVGYALWRLVFRWVWPAFARLPIERTIWLLGLFWIGTLLDVVFASLPLQRLVASDIAEQPGALTSLIVIIVVVIVIAINQVRVIRKTGYLPKYLTLAAVGGVIIALLAAVPETGLRLHHYIIALVLLPFTAFETRLSLIYSSFLLGMFLNGVGRWGYDGIIQDESVIQGDSVSNTGGIPTFINASTTNFTGLLNASTSSPANATRIYWQPIPADTSYDGFDLMVDDVLRLESTGQTYFDLASIASFYVGDASASNATFFPGGSDAANINRTVAELPHYLRLAYTTAGSAGDFTRAAVAWPNGTFEMPEEGRT